MHPDWARSLRDQCAAAGVPFFFKQWGEWYPAFANDYAVHKASVRETRKIDGAVIHRLGKKASGRLLDGQLHDAMPQVRA
jgi:protein gp37